MTRYSYPWMTRRLSAHDIVMMNNGYEEDPPLGLKLDESDEPNRYPLQLYHATATQAGDLAGKRVLEVGCGHGGGASYLTRTHRPASYTGLDLNPAGIEFCRTRHQIPNLDFVRGNAEDLPFPDESFDAVINVESSHCYPHLDVFLNEVARVLTPGGHFLYADSRPKELLDEWDAALAKAPLRMMSQRDIRIEVMLGMQQTRWELASMGKGDQRALKQLFGLRDDMNMRNGKVYRELETEGFAYRIYLFTKPGAD
ncbi:SAM-dependent methyltransferase [Mycolicibacterium sp. (ex Dasyatis americana)]|nr:SAM-dependent methyltransferase [Mycolicibacterium sp. (ex Dasyatis americana)]